MWRFESTHTQQKETEYLDAVIERIEADEHVRSHAKAILDGVSAQEPLVSQSLLTPQDVRYHAEGPNMRDHLTLMLMVLTCVEEEKLHLIDIEEFRRLKGYEGEIQELEDTLKEQAAFFQVFILAHDVCKWVSLSFTSTKEPETFFESPSLEEKLKQRMAYLESYEAFAHSHVGKSPREIQAQFYLAHKIDVHYHNHARHIHARVYQELLDRLCQAHGLTERDRALLEDLVSHHMEFGSDFDVVRPKRIERYVHLATKRGFDADDFIDLMQGCQFLDGVCGSKRLGPRGYFHDPLLLINCLKSEQEYAPWRRAQKERERVEEEGRARNRLLKEVGLDGVALMDVLHMEPGRAFGLALRRIQAGMLGKAEMPTFGAKIDQEIEKRVAQFYQKAFKKGE
ncbi:hypothetical protein HZA87_02085 [Candidatus Uhrbacteria bacterium]|nr:hypothetical protein [Candidatus Uhrbacteria bacterium]